MTEEELITEFIIDDVNKLQQDSYKVPEMLKINNQKSNIRYQ